MSRDEEQGPVGHAGAGLQGRVGHPGAGREDAGQGARQVGAGPAGQTVVVAVCQLPLQILAAQANRATARLAVLSAAKAGAGIVVLPELTPSGYVFASKAEACSVAEPPDGPTATEWAHLAAQHDLVIVGGFCEMGPGDHLFNSAVVIDRAGLRAVYRKAHLWDAEPDVFTPGEGDPPVVATRHGRVAVMICYDAEFSEWVRKPALAGAELLAVPVNWPAQPRPPGERAMEVVNAQAQASANRMFIAVADRCRAERGVGWIGGSLIAGPDGYPLAGPAVGDEPATLLAACDLSRAASKACGPRNDVHADRRPDLYSEPANMTDTAVRSGTWL